MRQLTSYELQEAHMALERGGVIVDASLLKRIAELELKVESHEKALRRARKMIKELKS